MAILLLLILLFGMALFFAVFFQKSFARSLPVSFCLMVVVLFLSGIFGALQTGVWLVVALSVGLGLAGLAVAWRNKEFDAVRQRILTPATMLFLLAVLWSVYTSYGRVADAWDEFSHWADTVKRMSVLHVIPRAADGAQFPSYPPAMALLQYFMQMLDSSAPFSEWLLYVSYQIFTVAILLPMFDGLSLKDGKWRFLLAALLLLMQPIVLFYHPIGKLFIDCFLGILFGAVLSFGVSGKTDMFDRIGFCLMLFVLVLTKEVGLLFALLAAAIMAAEQLIFCKTRRGGLSVKTVGTLFLPFASILSAKLLWNGFTARQAVDGSQGLSSIRGGVLEALTEAPQAAFSVIKSYIQQFFSFTQRVGMMKMSFFTLLVLCLLGCAVLLYERKRNDEADYPRLRFRLFAATGALMIYIGSLMLLYVTWSVYSPYEAENLASYDRYLNTGFTAYIVCLAAAAWHALGTTDGATRKKFAAVIAVIAALLLPLPDLMELGTRKTVRESVQTRAPYAVAVAEAERLELEAGADILFVAQDTAGYEWQTMRYCLQPDYALPDTVWSFRCPGDANNIWTTYLTAEDFSARYGAAYDYVLLFQLDTYFGEHYASCFADGVEIREGCWYYFDEESGLLVNMN